ncbi:mechanosensitive ion channel family protein [Rhizobium sp. P32RR-XVIII]|uniref:mechanosensitive ion channel family protein n=1 Tax=Rhizobium sp. P32RR-XVIII TaxID=2726738 RepID=UPI001456F7EB|nr:mechanosensitive ion channel family protein [Rhizobium sp. P32RR-XVIII]NLS08307.1 mechanosensitive ion channel family protein [Rhizobium sp. P32RR-XVIII]
MPPRCRQARGCLAAVWTCSFFVVTLGLFSALPAASWAQQSPAALPPEKARQFLELVNDPQLKSWLEARAAAPEEKSSTLADAIESWETAVHDRLNALVAALPRIPAETANAAAVITREVNHGRPGLVAGILAVLAVVGFGAEWLVRRGLRTAQKTGARGAKARLEDAVAIPTFALASVGSFLAFEWPLLLRHIVLTIMLAFIALRIVRAISKLLLAQEAFAACPPDQVAALLPEQDAGSFWYRQITVIAAVVLFGWAVVSLMPGLGFSFDVARLAALLFGQALLWLSVAIAWQRPDSSGGVAGKCLVSLFLIALWLAWAAGLLELLWIGIFALVLPSVVRAAGNLARALAKRWRGEGVFGVVVDVLAVRGARAAVIGLAVAWLAYIWRQKTASLFANESGAAIVSGLMNAIIILLVADLLWQLSKALIEYRMTVTEAGGSSDQVARNARMRTLLPIFRNGLAVFICVVTVLTILAGMGVQILPLIAGAGVVGVAIGFGSQTLVKDVLSGVLYLVDDAFRVGEYIQAGSYKGTVESFSLRSVRLRHHRGPVYTVPFGELGAIQNMSRDWSIEKMTIGVTYDSNIELARKLVKKIGQELAKDPEFAADTIEPLKMQGIDSFGDFAIVLKIKMMTKPGTQFVLKRRALMMIKKAFEENGIKIAVPTVHVDSSAAETPAAAQQIIKMQHDSKLAASQVT